MYEQAAGSGRCEYDAVDFYEVWQRSPSNVEEELTTSRSVARVTSTPPPPLSGDSCLLVVSTRAVARHVGLRLTAVHGYRYVCGYLRQHAVDKDTWRFACE